MSNLNFLSVRELVSQIKAREVSAAEVTDAHLAQIQRHNGDLNAIVTLDEEGAKARAKEADEALEKGVVWGPLHGVPVTIKDSLETAGLRTTAGFPPLADYIPTVDATVVSRVRQAGAIILGKTNLPTLSGDYQSSNPIFGRSNNPWNLERTPGGSTGGGAAAVAAGLSALEIGSDLAGSLRIPAHFCGLCSIMATNHRISRMGHIPELPGAPRGLRFAGVMGPIARSVGDLRIALRLLAGPDGRWWDVPPVPLEDPPIRKLQDLRIAWTDDFGGVPVTGETRTGLASLAQKLNQAGVTVARSMPEDFDLVVVSETLGELVSAETGSAMSPEAERARVEMFGVGPESEDHWERGFFRGVNASMRQVTEARMRRDALITAMEQFLQDWDVLLCPVTSTPAPPHCDTGSPIDVDGRAVPYFTAGCTYTMPFNLTGQPVVVIPLTQSSEGLPIGLQIVGRRWGEMALLQIAEQLEALIGTCRHPQGY
ncbi:MAG: amidase family protein [bacterium]|nr:amidase family protein [bacterium]